MSVKSQAIELNEKTKNTNNKNKYVMEKVAKNVFFISALVAVVSLLLIPPWRTTPIFCPNICLSNITMYHYESKSRGYEASTEKHERFLKEAEYMKNKWKNKIDEDKYFSKNNF